MLKFTTAAILALSLTSPLHPHANSTADMPEASTDMQEASTTSTDMQQEASVAADGMVADMAIWQIWRIWRILGQQRSMDTTRSRSRYPSG